MKLGYSEGEIFRMTPRKFFKIYNEYLNLNGIRSKKKIRRINSIDMLP